MAIKAIRKVEISTRSLNRIRSIWKIRIMYNSNKIPRKVAAPHIF